jgi:hypothetical protein
MVMDMIPRDVFFEYVCIVGGTGLYCILYLGHFTFASGCLELGLEIFFGKSGASEWG